MGPTAASGARRAHRSTQLAHPPMTKYRHGARQMFPQRHGVYQVPKVAKIHICITMGDLGGSCGNRPGLVPTGLLFASQATTTLSHRDHASPATAVTRPPR